ncbi:hypothetical protein JCM30566_15890 [Marinitoga arctica]
MKKLSTLSFILFIIHIFSLNIITSFKPLELIVRELAPEANIRTVYNDYDSFLNLNVNSNDFENVDLFVILDKEINLEKNINSVVLSEGVLYYPYEENPFIWSDPLYTVVIAYKIEKRLEILFPEKSIEFRNNLLDFTQKIVDLSDDFSKYIKNKKINIVDSNNIFIHFYKRYNIKYTRNLSSKDQINFSNYKKTSILNKTNGKKFFIDVFASEYNNIIDYYKQIIDIIVN